jgi:hypothetical protein
MGLQPFQAHQLYTVDLKSLLNVEPVEVWNRVVNSLLPGWHTAILLEPDVYGPTIGVFCLPQVRMQYLIGVNEVIDRGHRKREQPCKKLQRLF